MHELYIGEIMVYTDYLVYSPTSKQLVMANLLERSKMTISSAVSMIYRNREISTGGITPKLATPGDYLGYIESFTSGKVKYHQAIVKSNLMYSKLSEASKEGKISVVIVENENQHIKDVLFDALTQLSDLPLLHEWKDYLYQELQKSHLSRCRVVKSDDFSYSITEGSKTTDLANWNFYQLSISTMEVDELITNGLKYEKIQISTKPQKRLNVKSLDEYFQVYGPKVIENVMKELHPRLERIPKITYQPKKKIAFPAQAEVINGVINHFKNNDFMLINGSMGVGKSFISSIADAMLFENSRTLVMGPSLILEKWADEILNEVHGASVQIIRTFDQVANLRHLKAVEPNGKEYYLFSKDFLKLSFESIPTVTRELKKTLPVKVCNDCDKVYFSTPTSVKCSCGSEHLTDRRTKYMTKGCQCPECGELAMPSGSRITDLRDINLDDGRPLTLESFSNMTNKNKVCGHCNASLWQPNVQNLKSSNQFSSWQEKRDTWMKIKLPRNKSNKTFKTEFITKRNYREQKNMGLLNENHSVVMQQKTRKYSPAKYIKNVLGKDFFDVGIFDEVHMFKSGSSAQANAFGQLLKSTKKKICLTGTLAGGVAIDLFFLLFRLDPQLMLTNGYSYEDSMRFAADYGVVEHTKTYENEEVFYNKSSNGYTKSMDSIKPGISPLLFSQFLINNTIFLDLDDFEQFMVEVEEIPVSVKMDLAQKNQYTAVQNMFKEQLHQEGGKKLMGQILPTLLSLPDVNELSDIIHPTSGDLLYRFTIPKESFYGDDGLLNKERKLLEIVQSELKENRNCFIYSEFTADGDKNSTERLKFLIEERLGLHEQVAILKASSPSAIKRMSWIKEQAQNGVKVFITNPRLVEVGLDFIFKHEGKVYNYPTIIFYQVGYNLLTAWQASARHRRLIQFELCRTYYLYYDGTLQTVSLESLANKKAATAALQGTFSEEGLIAMASSIDPRVQLANALMNGNQSNDIDKLFDKINERKNVELSSEDKALMNSIQSKFKNDEEIIVNNQQLTFGELPDDFLNLFKIQVIESTIGNGKKALIKGQLTLF